MIVTIWNIDVHLAFIWWITSAENNSWGIIPGNLGPFFSLVQGLVKTIKSQGDTIVWLMGHMPVEDVGLCADLHTVFEHIASSLRGEDFMT